MIMPAKQYVLVGVNAAVPTKFLVFVFQLILCFGHFKIFFKCLPSLDDHHSVSHNQTLFNVNN